MQGKVFEREALYALPALLASLLDVDTSDVKVEATDSDEGFDAVVRTSDRIWLAEVKASASPGVVVGVAETLRSRTRRLGEGLLIVEHMSKAGAAAAAENGLSWVDLSGNGRLRAKGLHVWVEGRPRRVSRPGRPQRHLPRRARE